MEPLQEGRHAEIFIINKTDKENVDVSAVVEELKEKFGTSVATLDDRDALSEAIAETDEELMEKFFDVGEFTDEEFAQGLINGIRQRRHCSCARLLGS